MKKNKYLKYIIYIFMFLVMFCSNGKNVKAQDKFVCYYRNDEYDASIYVQLTYDKGNVDISYYNYSTNKVSKENGNYHDSNLGMIFKIKDSSGKNINASDFVDGCPPYLYQKVYDDTSAENDSDKGIEYDIYKGKEYDAWLDFIGRENSVLSDFGKQRLNSYYFPEHTVDLDNIINCSYTLESFAYQDDFSPKLTLKFKQDGSYKKIYVNSEIRTETYNPNENYNPTLDNTFDKLNSTTTCPSKIYSKNNFTNFSLSGDDNELGKNFVILKTYTYKPENENMSNCDRLGGIKKYIRQFFNIVKFLIPFIIIVMSTISFLTIVVSGDSEKMQKAKKDFIIRLIVGILILFIPILLEVIFKLAGIINEGENLSDIVCSIIS